MIGWENNQGAYFINKLQDEVNAVSDKTDDVAGDIGKLSDLTTTAKTSIVAAINEVNGSSGGGEIGNLSDLTTTAKTNVVSAINEVDGDIGNLSDLYTYHKNNLVDAVNELCGEFEDLGSYYVKSERMTEVGSANQGQTIQIDFHSAYSMPEDFIVISGGIVSNRVGMWLVHLDSEGNIYVYPVFTAGNQISISVDPSWSCNLIIENTLASGSGYLWINVICVSSGGTYNVTLPE